MDDLVRDPDVLFLQLLHHFLPVATGPAFVVCTDCHQKSRRFVRNRVQDYVQVLVDAVEFHLALQ